MPKDLPEKGDLVICTVTQAKGFGAFVKLEEYPDKKGFLHIKEVASGWVKNIREYVREGQRIVCKVMNVDPSKGYVDLSLKRVTEHQKREKIEKWKNEQKAKKLLEIVANKIGKNFDEFYNEVEEELIKKYNNLYRAFEEAVKNEKKFRKEFDAGWVDAFIEVAKQNIVVPFVEISGYVELTCPLSDGINHIIKALEKIEEENELKIRVKYISAPLYRIEVTAPDYKIAEKKLKENVNKAIEYIKKHKGDGKFIREMK
ncbi:MAG: translation initiation factor IF-2 subunit alpha [Thermoplasmatales archaeon]|nr:translation initiation factor IF-2 subunit alpha [Thermoplasmatales archaeon]